MSMCFMKIQLTPMNWNKVRWLTALNQLTIEKHNDNKCRTIINPLSRLRNPNLCVSMNFDKCETISIVSQFYLFYIRPTVQFWVRFSSNHFSWMQFNPIRFYSHRISFSLLYTGPMFFFSLFVDFSINFFFFSNFCWISCFFLS